MTRVFFLVLLLFGHRSFAQSIDKGFGKPIFWYHISDPWGMFMGAEGPQFILFDNGKVLFWKNGAYNLTELNEDEKRQLVSDLNLTDTLFQKERYYNATNPDPNGEMIATDNPSYTVC